MKTDFLIKTKRANLSFGLIFQLYLKELSIALKEIKEIFLQNLNWILNNPFDVSKFQIQKLVIIRHGQSLWNKQKRWAGWSDVRLSQIGIKQAEQCGKLLKSSGIGFDIAFTSLLTRSIQTLNIILDQLSLHYIPVYKSWRLNQKHYGRLTVKNLIIQYKGQRKIEIAKKYGQKQVAEWRRSFNIAPPPVDVNDKYHPARDRRYANIDQKDLPLSENQGDLVRRIQPLWCDEISKRLAEGKNVLISAHGGSARALVKIISNLPNEEIMEFNLPNATPLVYTFQIGSNNELKIKSMQLIGDQQEIKSKMQRVKNEINLSSQ